MLDAIKLLKDSNVPDSQIYISLKAKTRPAYEKLHGRPFRSIATMVQNLLNYELLGSLLRHGNGIGAVTSTVRTIYCVL